MTSLTLNNGISSRRGWGCFRSPMRQNAGRASSALETGYRLIDTAACYGNERAVGGRETQWSPPGGGVPHVQSLIQDAGTKRPLASFEKTLDNLGTDYLDLYLIHMPYGDYHGDWRAMETLPQAGRVRAIGVQLPAGPSGGPDPHPLRGARCQPNRAAPFCQQSRLCGR